MASDWQSVSKRQVGRLRCIASPRNHERHCGSAVAFAFFHLPRFRDVMPVETGRSHRGEIRLDFSLYFDLTRAVLAFDANTSDSS